MNPDAQHLWPGRRWTLAMLLAALSTIGPFSIDAYLPAFDGIQRAMDASPVEMQQTLSAYLVGFAVMNLFHGALADSLGRRPVVLMGMVLFAISSAGCALSPNVGTLVFFRVVQGMSAGAGMVVARAIIRDMFPPHEAQRMMSQVTLFFGVAPAVAPIIGGWVYVHLGWSAVFWVLVGLGVLLAGVMAWRLPETLNPAQRQPFSAGHLMRGYAQLGLSPRFLALCLAAGVPFNGMFLYVLSAPVFLGVHMKLAPTQFFWLFLVTIGGIMGGAWLSGRLAGRITPQQQVRYGFCIMLVIACVNLLFNCTLTLSPFWALPLLGLLALGWALMVPVVTLLVLEEAPERRGMASSLQACIASIANAVVAGVVSPLVMHSLVAMAVASLVLTLVGLVAWAWVAGRLSKAPQPVMSEAAKA